MGCIGSKQKDGGSPVSAPKERVVAVEGGSSSIPVERDVPEQEEELWYYVDLLKALQGPFTTPQMKLWLNAGYLPDDLEVRLSTEQSFTQLRYRKHEIDPSFPRIQPNSVSAVSPRETPAPASASQSQPGQVQVALSSQPQSQPHITPRATQVDVSQKAVQGKVVNQDSLVNKPRAVVLYPYQAQRNDELNIKRADVVTILFEGRNWCEVIRKGQVGKVPGNYIEKIFPTEKVVAMYDYTPNGIPSCLTFKKGNVIEVVEKQADGWWKGIFEEVLGAFPSSFVQPHHD